MPARIFVTAEFDRFARKAKIVDTSLVGTVARAEAGLVDANLGGNVAKLRIARPGQGRSGGYRTIVALVAGTRAIYLLGFAKSEMENVGKVTVNDLREVAKYLLTITDEAVDGLVKAEELREIER